MDSTAGGSGGSRASAAAGNWWQAVLSLRGERWGAAAIGYLFIFPAMALYVTFGAYPLIRGLVIAFSDYRFLLLDHQPFNGLANFIELLNDDVFWKSFGRSAYYTAIRLPLEVILGLAIAVLISKIERPAEASVYRVIAYLPVVLPMAVALLVWKSFLHPQLGYLNHFLRETVGIANPPAWLATETWVIPTMAVIGVWKHVGQNIMLFLVGLYNINRELYEAAAIDGANIWIQFTAITLPLLRPTMAVVLVMSAGIIGTAQESLIIFGPTQAGPANTGMLVGRYSYEIAFLVGDLRWGYAAAMNLVIGVVSILISGIVLKWVRFEA